MASPADEPPASPRPWRVVTSRLTYRDRWLTVRSDDCMTESGRVVAPYHVLEYPHWLNVLALTDEGHAVLIREYRHAGGIVLLGLPSGTMDPSDPDAEGAARRELWEETGYVGGEYHLVGRHPANPANQTNTSFLFLALGVRATAERRLDPTEEIEVVVEPFVPFAGRVLRGEVEVQLSHAATVNAAVLHLLAGRVEAPAGLVEAIRGEVGLL